MTTDTLDALLRHLRLTSHADCWTAASDGELLEVYCARGEESAFAELIRRHGPMVLGTCRRVLGNLHDAEDAFQATFAVLAAQAASLRREKLGGWLHCVAARTAGKVRRGSQRRDHFLRRLRTMAHSPLDPDATWEQVKPILDEELERLPDWPHRLLVACYLQGKTNIEAARELGVPAGSMARHLARARELLRRALVRRGVVLPTALLGAGLAQAAAAVPVPAVLLVHARATALAFAAGALTPSLSPIATLAKGVLSALSAKPPLLLVLGLCLALAGASLVACRATSPPPDLGRATEAPATPGEQPGQRAPRDQFDDPLPPGAVLRLGTDRLRHPLSLYQFAFAPDGKVLATAGFGGIRLWETASGKCLRQLPGQGANQQVAEEHLQSVSAFAFAPDGKTLVTAANDQRLRLWDVVTGKEIRSLPNVPTEGQVPQVACVAFSPDGKLLATAELMEVRLFETTAGKEIRRLDHKSAGILGFSPDSRTLASASCDGSMYVWEVATGKELSRSRSPERINLAFLSLDVLSFSPDRKVLAAAGMNGTVRFLDLATGKKVRDGPRQEGKAHAVLYAPDGKTLAVASSDNGVSLWDLAGGKLLRKLDVSARTKLAFSPDGKLLASAEVGDARVSNNVTVLRLWDTSTGKEVRPQAGPTGPILALTHGPGGNTLSILEQDGTIRRCQASTGKQIGLTPAPVGGFLARALSADGTKVLALNMRGSARLLDAVTGRLLLSLEVGMSVRAVAIAPGCRLLATVGEKGHAALWDGQSGKRLHQLRGHEAPVTAVAFSADGKRLATADNEGRIHVWDSATGAPITWKKAEDDSESPMLLYSRGWGAEIMSLIRRKERLENQVPDQLQTLAFSPDGSFLAAADKYGCQVWELGAGREIGFLAPVRDREWGPPPPGLVATEGGLAFLGNGRVVATVCEKEVRLLDLATGKELPPLRGHQGTITALAASPDGKTLTSGSADTTGLTWDLTRLIPKDAARQLTGEESEAAWFQTAGVDEARAYQAARALAGCPRGLALLRERLSPRAAPNPQQLEGLIADLDDDNFPKREAACKQLEQCGEAAVPALKAALKANPSVEARKRMETLLERQVDKQAGRRYRPLRAILALEHTGTREARQLLEALGSGPPGAWLTEQAKKAQERLARRTTTSGRSR